MEYKWIALTNTTLGILMASIDINIVIIAMPAIFRGIDLNPLASFQYLLWILFGYSIVTATLLVTFGRLSDIFGRVRLYNMGFAIYTIGSLLLFLTPNKGEIGATELVVFRLVQASGGAFLFSNSAAILTDAFSSNERGKALGINQVAFLAGSILGLVLGGVLAVYDWRYVFLVSVPFGAFGTVWSYLELKEIATIRKNQKLDPWGNITFGAGLTLLLISVSYGIVPYGSSSMGWNSPYVVAGLIISAILLGAFPFVERHVRDPMFRLVLFRRRAFAAGNFAALLSSLARGGVTLLLVILLQAIWLPLHGFSYSVTPFWAGVYMIPFSLGFVVMGPLSGYLSDKYGARVFSTAGMLLTAAAFLTLSTYSYNFDYLSFAVVIFMMGMAMGLFSSPYTASIMNSVPPEHRGVASGMRSTFQNSGITVGLGVLFTVVLLALAVSLPGSLASAAANVGAPQLTATTFAKVPPATAVFSAFLGYNPMQTILGKLPQNITASLSNQTTAALTSTSWFPQALAPAFMSSLRVAFYVNAGLAVAAAISSALRGKRFVFASTVEPKDSDPVQR